MLSLVVSPGTCECTTWNNESQDIISLRSEEFCGDVLSASHCGWFPDFGSCSVCFHVRYPNCQVNLCISSQQASYFLPPPTGTVASSAIRPDLRAADMDGDPPSPAHPWVSQVLAFWKRPVGLDRIAVAFTAWPSCCTILQPR